MQWSHAYCLYSICRIFSRTQHLFLYVNTLQLATHTILNLHLEKFFLTMETVYKTQMIMKAIIRQKRPIASHKANPRIAYVKSWPFNDGFLAKPIAKLLKTFPIPAPEIEKSLIRNLSFRLKLLLLCITEIRFEQSLSSHILT